LSYTCTVKQGDLLTEEDATFIVNASNTRLVLGSGVSMAFKHHCGIELQDEMLKSLEKVGEPLKQGDVVTTSSGKANNFVYALHAAVMNYNAGTKHQQKMPTLAVIQTALENIEGYLNWYADKTDEPLKLVLPLIGCGVGGLDKRDVLELYKNFFSREVSFSCHVIIYGYNQQDYDLAYTVFNNKGKKLS